REAAESITPQDLYARIEFIASDQMRGRDTPSPELEIAAGYLVNQYRLYGLQPAGEDGTFYQWYPFPLRRLSVAGARLEFAGRGAAQTLALGRDFFALGGTAASLSAGMVFVGQGQDAATAPGTLRDQVAVMLLPGNGNRAWRLMRNQQRNAARRAGAVAVVHVLDAVWSADSVQKYGTQAMQPSRTLGTELAFPEFFVTRDAAGRVFSAAGLDLDALAARAADPAFRPVPVPGITVAAGLPVETVEASRAPNVVAMIPGSDPVLRNEYVVLSAHMDHVGVGQAVNGDSIYNGADDDGSGTTGILEVAEAFARLGARPKRTIVFLHVSGEEKGLLGSEWFSEHPTLPLDRIVANINVDMIGRNNPDSVVVIGKQYSSLGAVANRVAAAHPELHLTLSDDLWPQENFFFRSDHFNFARKEIPAIFFFSGVHEDYHRPSDEVEKIDTDKAARIARMVFYIANEIANDPQRPQWDPAGLAEVRRLTR
ncbi:MAG TPA: M20/M25/M40 family metallo-hydrolase, partial [Longimicrobiaceae bacterium]|nr:M20/M25/M40 family metallo-hydrolase [Longimicrobiaceae bacterium]